MREEWKAFVRQLGLPAGYLHRDELKAIADLKHYAFPAIRFPRDRRLDESVE